VVRQAIDAESFSVMSLVHRNRYKSEWAKTVDSKTSTVTLVTHKMSGYQLDYVMHMRVYCVMCKRM